MKFEQWLSKYRGDLIDAWDTKEHPDGSPITQKCLSDFIWQMWLAYEDSMN